MMKRPSSSAFAARSTFAVGSAISALVLLAAPGVALAQDAPAVEPAPAPAPAEEAAPAPAIPAAQPAPEPAPTPPPPAATASSAASPPASSPASSSERERPDDYYSRQRGVGMFHSSRLVLGALAGSVPDTAMDAMSLADKDVTMYSLAFEGVYLGLPSSYGNFHGIEFSAGVRTSPWDFWASFGTAISFLNVGRGGPGSFRLGGSFGAGFNLAHGYGYVRGRVAMVILPARLDAEVSASWTPTSASTQHYEEIISRASLWYRPNRGSDRAYEAFVESFSRQDDRARDDREVSGLGAGFGMTLF
jgi:hypothetical protein